MDAHYGGNVVAGARILQLFGDAVTGLSAVQHGDEGLLSRWDEVRFLKPVHPGDFIRVDAEVVKTTKLRRFVAVSAWRTIRGLSSETSEAESVEPAECVAEANGVFVIPYAKARRGGNSE